MRFFAAFLLLPTLVQAQLSQIDMTEREVWDFLGNNTIGSNDFGDDNSIEYHGTNGQALWFFEEELQVGYFRVKGNRVCYTYEGEDLRTWFCWIFKKDRRTGEIWQWTDNGEENATGYRMFIVGRGDLATPQDEA